MSKTLLPSFQYLPIFLFFETTCTDSALFKGCFLACEIFVSGLAVHL